MLDVRLRSSLLLFVSIWYIFTLSYYLKKVIFCQVVGFLGRGWGGAGDKLKGIWFYRSCFLRLLSTGLFLFLVLWRWSLRHQGDLVTPFDVFPCLICSGTFLIPDTTTTSTRASLFCTNMTHSPLRWEIMITAALSSNYMLQICCVLSKYQTIEVGFSFQRLDSHAFL